MIKSPLATRKRTIDQEINELLPLSNAATDYLGQLANDAKQWVEAIQEYANITELDAATLNRLIKEIVVHERIDEDKTRHISIEIHFNLKPIPEVEQVTA